MATALAACKILREMAHLEAEAEADRGSRGASYEQLALGEPPPGLGTLLGLRASPRGPGHPHGDHAQSHSHAGAWALWWEGRQGTETPRVPGETGRVGMPRQSGAWALWWEGRWGDRGRAGGRPAERRLAAALPAGLFSECYHNSEDRAFALLVRRTHSWSRTTCLHLATEADTKAFFAHEGVQVSGGGRGRARRPVGGRCPLAPPPPAAALALSPSLRVGPRPRACGPSPPPAQLRGPCRRDGGRAGWVPAGGRVCPARGTQGSSEGQRRRALCCRPS